MSFIAGYIAGLSEGGSSYTNEDKTITSNGEYEPDEGVRWSSVIVNVPSGASAGDILGVVRSTPAFYSQTFEDGFTIDFCVDFDNKLSGFMPQSYMTSMEGATIGEGGFGPNKKSVMFIPSIRRLYFKFVRVLKDGEFVFAVLENTNYQFMYEELWGWTNLGKVDKKTMYDIVPRAKSYCKAEGVKVADGSEVQLAIWRDNKTGYYTGVAIQIQVKVAQYEEAYYYKEDGTYDYDVHISDSEYTFPFTGIISASGMELYTPLQGADLLRAVTDFLVMAIRHNGMTVSDPYDYNPSSIK